MNDVQELDRAARATPIHGSPDAAARLKSYAVSAALFSGAPDALYERHLKYDNIVEPDTANTRERYKAAARAVRDILSDRWLRTHKTYARENPKRIYYIFDRVSYRPFAWQQCDESVARPYRRTKFQRRWPRVVGDPSRGARCGIGQWR